MRRHEKSPRLTRAARRREVGVLTIAREKALLAKALEKDTSAADLRAKLTARLADTAVRLDGIDKRIIEIDLLVNEQRARFNETIRANTLREAVAVD
jgi:hypothetical protein